jgi:hypothetical protein
MRERGAQMETFRAGRALTIGSATLLPIERTVTHAGRFMAHWWFVVAKEPHALVVRDAGGIRAIAVATAQVSLERLLEEVPGLDTVLGSM